MQHRSSTLLRKGLMDPRGGIRVRPGQSNDHFMFRMGQHQQRS